MSVFLCNSFLSKKVQILAAGAFKNKLCLPTRGFFFFFFANNECARFCVCFCREKSSSSSSLYNSFSNSFSFHFSSPPAKKRKKCRGQMWQKTSPKKSEKKAETPRTRFERGSSLLSSVPRHDFRSLHIYCYYYKDYTLKQRLYRVSLQTHAHAHI